MAMKMKLLFPLLLLLFSKAVWSIRPPHIEGEDIQVVGTGGVLNLTCQGSKPLKWHKDGNDLHDGTHDDYIDFTHAQQNSTDFLFVSTLTIVDVISAERGNYTCYYDDSSDLNYNKETMDSVFVFVRGDHIFVSGHLNRAKLSVGETLKIDCSITDPSYTVTLKRDDNDIINDGRLKFDPRSGFSLEDVRLEDKGEYKCESGGYTLEGRIVDITNPTKDWLPTPSIHKGANQHFVKGDKFILKCSVLDHEVNFTWTYPNQGVKYEWINTIEEQNTTTYYNSILTVSKASEDDTGVYTCNISAEGFSPNSTFIDITINESKESFLNISSGDFIEAEEGQKDEIKWKTTISSYPSNPKITYTNWTGQELTATDRISIDYEEAEGLSWLRIKDVSDTDFGNYSIDVTVSDKEGEITESATVVFKVRSVPKMKIEGVPKYVSEGQELSVTCQARGFPAVNVSLLFQNCSSAKTTSCKSPTTIETDETNVRAPGNIFEKTAVISPNTSGLLWCNGMNVNGSRNEFLPIIMSDIEGIFVLHYNGADENSTDKKSITIVENDNFTLMCGGAKFQYKKVEVEVVSIQHTNTQIQFQSNNSKFSWQKVKEVGRANTSLTGRYRCLAYPHEDSDNPDVKNFDINVVAEEPVRFEETNMKNQTHEVKDGVDFTLKCMVTGRPQPTIRWLKDNKPLTEEFDEKAMGFSSDQKELTFSYVTKKHTGVYTCIANNRLNEVKASLTLETPYPGIGKTPKIILALLVVGLAISAIGVGFLMHRVKKEKEKSSNPFRRQGREFFETGNVESLNLTSTADRQAEMLPYDKKKWEVPRANINFGKQLGSGAFGRVIKAAVTGLQGPATTTVAVKMCKNDVNEAQLGAIISELKIMMYLGTHLNIVNLLGANTEHIGTGEIWILVEYCRFGNLLDFIIKRRKNFTNLISPETGKIDPNILATCPMSPTLSDCVPPSLEVDEEGYLAPTATQAVLSDPPEGHSAETVPSSDTFNSPSSNSIPQVTAGQFASNPMYSMNINTDTENPNRESKGSEDFTTSKFLQRKASRLMSIGSITLSDGSSVSRILRRPSQQSCHPPLSPTETCFMGENDPDILYEVGSVPGVTAPFSTIDLICWGWQMAQGMNYLSRRKILHGDLAARNLLLGDNNVLKISDFGLSRNMYRNDNYVKKGDDLLPIKWMSIEAIRDKIFSIESDAWAFGITLWEIFSLGCSPYAGVEVSHDFLEELENGHRMSCPKYGNEEIYKIMKLCWEEDPMERPSFSQLVDDLGTMISDQTERYLSQNEEYMQMNTERFKEETDYLSMMAKPTFENRMKPDEIEIEHYLPMNVSVYITFYMYLCVIDVDNIFLLTLFYFYFPHVVLLVQPTLEWNE